MKKHRKIIAIQGDPLNSLNRKTDTTLLLALEAQKRGYKIYYYETKNLTFLNGKIISLCKEVVFHEKNKKFYSIKNLKIIDLSKKGLEKRSLKNNSGKDESIFLRSVESIINNKKTKADITIEKFKNKKDLSFLYEKT